MGLLKAGFVHGWSSLFGKYPRKLFAISTTPHNDRKNEPYATTLQYLSAAGRGNAARNGLILVHPLGKKACICKMR